MKISFLNRFSMATLLVMALFIHSSQAFAVESLSNCDPGLALTSHFQVAWDSFRESVSTNNLPQTMSMVLFPLEVSDALGSESPNKIMRKDFIEFFNAYLEEDSGEQDEPQSIRDYIHSMHCIPNTMINDTMDEAQVGPLIFIKMDDHQWHLTEVFSSVD